LSTTELKPALEKKIMVEVFGVCLGTTVIEKKKASGYQAPRASSPTPHTNGGFFTRTLMAMTGLGGILSGSSGNEGRKGGMKI